MLRRCHFCGCTENRACYDPETGMTCCWATEESCSFCVEWDENREAVAATVFLAATAHALALGAGEYTPSEREFAKRAYDAAVMKELRC
jgi:hypothetical protein